MSMSQNNKISKKLKAEIHCPISGCLFAEGSERHFTAKKFLEQHIARVHAEKKYLCTKCKKGFGLDLYRKHHEKNCGIIWECDCGAKYPSRESLLTHARRTQHKLPDYALPVKKNQRKALSTAVSNPVIFLIQPIIQNITYTHQKQCVQPLQTSAVTPKRILPKTPQPLLLTLPGTTTSIPLIKDTSPVIFKPVEDVSLLTSIQPLSNAPETLTSLSVNNYCTEVNKKANFSANYQETSNTVSTQTVDKSASSTNLRLSQASQCSRRKPKSMKVGIENQTQTAESAVIKIKKKRSRRKSVSITTETSMATDRTPDSDNMFWPGFSDFVNSLGVRMFKNCASTQTNTTKNKTVCDSETLTDHELIKFAWDQTVKLKNVNEKKNMNYQIIGNDQSISTSIDNNREIALFSQNQKDIINCQMIHRDQSFDTNSDMEESPIFSENLKGSTSCHDPSVDINNDNMQELTIYSSQDNGSMNCQMMGSDQSVGMSIENKQELTICSQNEKDNMSYQMMGSDQSAGSDNIQNLNIFSENNFESKLCNETADCSEESKQLACTSSSKPQENCSMFSVFGNCDKPIIDNKAPHASTLDIHTQTMASAVLDYNLLTNMETQTTDDFNFTYLEFSDTETQTPWEDFVTIDDSPLQADQLSIEIQTDFSSFGSAVNLDPYELFNSVDVQNMGAGCPNKETANVNTETQTLDGFYFPQFTNSESQTLDISDFFCYS